MWHFLIPYSIHMPNKKLSLYFFSYLKLLVDNLFLCNKGTWDWDKLKVQKRPGVSQKNGTKTRKKEGICRLFAQLLKVPLFIKIIVKWKEIEWSCSLTKLQMFIYSWYHKNTSKVINWWMIIFQIQFPMNLVILWAFDHRDMNLT